MLFIYKWIYLPLATIKANKLCFDTNRKKLQLIKLTKRGFEIVFLVYIFKFSSSPPYFQSSNYIQYKY